MSLIYSFANDYSKGCHPSILENFTSSNYQQFNGYAEDPYTIESSNSIRKKINNSEADVHLIAGGTLSNLVVLGAILKPFKSVISADSGHINTHETGAIEATRHKIESISTIDGKLMPELILDGARIASGIISSSSYLTLEEIEKQTTIFYLRATKCGGNG